MKIPCTIFGFSRRSLRRRRRWGKTVRTTAERIGRRRGTGSPGGGAPTWPPLRPSSDVTTTLIFHFLFFLFFWSFVVAPVTFLLVSREKKEIISITLYLFWPILWGRGKSNMHCRIDDDQWLIIVLSIGTKMKTTVHDPIPPFKSNNYEKIPIFYRISIST